jgi:ribosome-binding factor A
MNERRSQRVSEALREELTELIGYEMDDPRLSSVSVTDVLLTPDLKQARILVTADAETVAVLDRARHFLRREVARRLRLFRVPDLRFEPGAGVAPDRIETLLKRVRKGRPREKNSSE